MLNNFVCSLLQMWVVCISQMFVLLKVIVSCLCLFQTFIGFCQHLFQLTRVIVLFHCYYTSLKPLISCIPITFGQSTCTSMVTDVDSNNLSFWDNFLAMFSVCNAHIDLCLWRIIPEVFFTLTECVKIATKKIPRCIKSVCDLERQEILTVHVIRRFLYVVL